MTCAPAAYRWSTGCRKDSACGVKFLVLKEILNTIAVTKPQTNELWYWYIQLLFYRNQINSGEGGIEITGGT